MASPSDGKTNTPADRTNSSGRAQVELGKIYRGTVTDTGAGRGQISVILDEVDSPVTNCIWAAGIFSAMIGIRSNFIPTKGTRVAVLTGTPSLIFGNYSAENGDPAGNAVSAATTSFGLREGIGLNAGSTNVPVSDGADPLSDLLPGELTLQNIFGVGIQLLTNFAKLGAGDLAKIEVHMLNDMVRIVSENYKHHSSFGDFEIFNDGRLNAVFNGTSYAHEAFGALSPESEKISSSDNGVDFGSVDAISATGRWRFSQYLGFLGNFLHFFVTDPTAALGVIGESAIRSGKFGCHVDNDGSLLISSVADIVFERVVRIPVPIQARRPDDPQGVKSSEFERLDKRFLKQWKYPKNPHDMFEMTYQLREYARFLNQFQSLARFHQLQAAKGEYVVPDELSTPPPEWSAAEKDKREVNAEAMQYIDTYACIRIMRDGSIIQWDGYGSCSVMSHGDIRHCATRNLHLEAAGDIVLVAGQNIFAKARRSIEIVAVTGGMILKARAWWRALCEAGTLWIKSDAMDPSDPFYTPPLPDNAVEDPATLQNDAAVLIESSRGRCTLFSERTLMLHVNGNPDVKQQDNPDDVSASVCIQSAKQHVKIRARWNMSLQALKGVFGIKCPDRGLIIQAQAVWMRVKRKFLINKIYEFDASGRAKVPHVRAKSVSALDTIMGPAVPGPTPGGGKHFNHIRSLPEDTKALSPSVEDDELLEGDASKADAVRMSAETLFPVLGEMLFRFQTYSEYIRDPHVFIQSPAQQFLKFDVPEGDREKYAVSAGASELLRFAPRNDRSTAPWPGREAIHRVHAGGDNLHAPTPKSGLKLSVQTELTPERYNFSFLKFSATY